MKSRPSMEAVGIDVYKMAAQAGWDIYPIGSERPEDMPKGTLAASSSCSKRRAAQP